MKIDCLKFAQDKGWFPASQFVADNGRTMPIEANNKIVAVDENGDFVNLTIYTDKPLTFKQGQPLSISLTSGISKTAFGWSVKGRLS